MTALIVLGIIGYIIVGFAVFFWWMYFDDYTDDTWSFPSFMSDKVLDYIDNSAGLFLAILEILFWPIVFILIVFKYTITGVTILVFNLIPDFFSWIKSKLNKSNKD